MQNLKYDYNNCVQSLTSKMLIIILQMLSIMVVL